MDSDKNKLKKLFSESDPGLPPELGWEQMEEGIMEKMEELETAEAPSKQHNDTAFKIIATLLLCLLPILFFNKGLLLIRNGDQAGLSTDKMQPKDQASKATPTTSSLSLHPAESQPAVEKSKPVVATPEQASTVKPGTSLDRDASSKKAVRSLTPTGSADAQKTATTPELPTAEQRPQAAASSPTTRKQSAGENTYPKDGRTLTDVGDQQQLDGLLSPIASLPAIPISQQGQAKTDLPSVAAKPKSEHQLLPKHQMALTSGISTWKPAYGQVAPEAEAYEQSTLSFYAQLSYTYRFDNNFELSTGLQYQQLQTQLEWSQQIEDYTTVVLQDTIVEIQVNSLTGNSTAVRGDVEVSVNATRNIRHHNEYRLFQIPIAIGKSWAIGENWQAGISAGAAVNLLTQNKGRSIYQGELEYMDGPTTNLIDNRWGIHGLGSANVGYRINARWGVMAEAQFQKSLTDWSRVPGIQMQTEVTSFGLGIYYAL